MLQQNQVSFAVKVAQNMDYPVPGNRLHLSSETLPGCRASVFLQFCWEHRMVSLVL